MPSTIGMDSNNLSGIARLLSTSQKEKATASQEFHSLSMTGDMRELKVICPSLSLHHKKESHCGGPDHCSDRKHAEDRAVSLLNRPLNIGDDESDEPLQRIARYALAIRQNIYSAFAVLVESRLRAYADLLKRQVLAISFKKHFLQTNGTSASLADIAIEEWLAIILKNSAQIKTDAVVTRFDLQGVPYAIGNTTTAAAISFDVALDIPKQDHKEAKSISFSTSGKITSTCISLQTFT